MQAAPQPVGYRRFVMISQVIGWVSFETGVSIARIVGPGRAAPQVRARWAVAWVCHRVLDRSPFVIGRAMSRHHTTILHAVREAERMIGTDPAFEAMIAKLALRAALEARP